MAKKCHNHRLQANPTWHREEGTQSVGGGHYAIPRISHVEY